MMNMVDMHSNIEQKTIRQLLKKSYEPEIYPQYQQKPFEFSPWMPRHSPSASKIKRENITQIDNRKVLTRSYQIPSIHFHKLARIDNKHNQQKLDQLYSTIAEDDTFKNSVLVVHTKKQNKMINSPKLIQLNIDWENKNIFNHPYHTTRVSKLSPNNHQHRKQIHLPKTQIKTKKLSIITLDGIIDRNAERVSDKSEQNSMNNTCRRWRNPMRDRNQKKGRFICLGEVIPRGFESIQNSKRERLKKISMRNKIDDLKEYLAIVK